MGVSLSEQGIPGIRSQGHLDRLTAVPDEFCTHQTADAPDQASDKGVKAPLQRPSSGEADKVPQTDAKAMCETQAICKDVQGTDQLVQLPEAGGKVVACEGLWDRQNAVSVRQCAQGGYLRA